MKLIINRAQRDVKGMLGGHKGVEFTLGYRLVLTPEEAELVRRYNLSGYVLTTRGGTQQLTISSYVQGVSQAVSDVTTLVRNERVVKEACDDLPVLFDVCRSFGGDEVIEYPRNEADRNLLGQSAPDTGQA